MNYKALIILSAVFSMFKISVFAQTPTTLQGSAVSEAGEKVEFYTLILQSTSDSSVVSVEMFSDSEKVGYRPYRTSLI